MFVTISARAATGVVISVALLLLSVARPSSAQPRDGGVPAWATISGRILDPVGAALAGAHVALTVIPGTPLQRSMSGPEGEFTFTGVAPGAYVVVVKSPGFEAFATYPFTVAAREPCTLPPIRLSISALTTSIVVRPTEAIAEEQIKAQEQQRMLGVVPNFYVSYVPDAAPMNPRQKRSLAFHEAFDWTAFARAMASAGIQQATNAYAGYGGGPAGFAKRYAATFANERASDLLTHYVYASLFHQDPRYFYQGTGTTRSRLAHALSSPFVARGDDGRAMPNYASLLGNVSGAAVSNLYYARSDRGAGLVLTNVAVGIAGRAAYAVVQEFIGKRLTKNVPRSDSDGR